MTFNVPLLRDEDVDLSGDFGRALDLISSTANNYFVTGKAGTGKSTLLRYFIDHSDKKTALLAPTGLAAVNIGGQTVHSFFKFPPEPISREHIKVNRSQDLYRALEVLVIDEVSMVRADLMDGIDQMLRLNRSRPREPFGGVQMIFFGDIFQLEPVVACQEEGIFFSSEYRSPFFFDAKVFETAEFQIIDLQKVFRQKDKDFIDLLDAIRLHKFTHHHLRMINSRYRDNLREEDSLPHITLSSTNAIADDINERRLARLPEPEFAYYGQLEGEFPERSLPTSMVLNFRKGAQVMFVKNDYRGRWVNGTIGKIVDLADDFIEAEVIVDDFRCIHMVPIETWEVRKHRLDPVSRTIKTEVVGKFSQYPLKLAWAITIHKSQGLTFDHVIVDLGRGAFAHGQTYVALSRCTSFEGLLLKVKLRPEDVIVDPRAQRFYFDRLN
jgi:ATP-dependent DNA helicase PIF1